MDPCITGKLCRAARGLAGMTQDDLAANANVAKQTIASFERGTRRPLRNNRAAIQRALEGAGVAFITEAGNGVGVRLNGTGEAAQVDAEMVAPGQPA